MVECDHLGHRKIRNMLKSGIGKAILARSVGFFNLFQGSLSTVTPYTWFKYLLPSLP